MIKFVLDNEGNVYSFEDTGFLEKLLVSSEDMKSCEEDYSLLLYDTENLYRFPEETAREYIMGRRKLVSLMVEIEEKSFSRIKDEEFQNLAPVI